MKILVVDSDLPALETSAAYLRKEYPDAKIIATGDGMDAVQYSLNFPVDVVYTEVLMPHINGFNVARLVRKFRPEAEAYIVCGTDEFLERAREQGLSGYYLKPLGKIDGRLRNLLADAGTSPYIRSSGS